MRAIFWRLAVSLGVLAVVGSWIAFANLERIQGWLGRPVSTESLGQWGDTFGALNALFGSLGFMGLMATLWMQRRQIQSQQKEIEDGRLDQHRQRFEASFFQLLGLMRELRENIRYGSSSGLSALENTIEQVARAATWDTPDGASPAHQLNAAIKEYETSIIPHYQNTIGPYNRIVYNILNRLSKDTVLRPDEKHAYARLLRGQLTDVEISLIGINGLSSISKDFKDLIIEFRILKYAVNRDLSPLFRSVYPPDTFKSRRNRASSSNPD